MDFTLELNNVNAEIRTCPATVLHGLRRGGLMAQAKEESDAVRWYARYWLYSACLACSSGTITLADGASVPVERITFEQWLALPEQIINAWMAAVYHDNPHWKPDFTTAAETDAEKKKAPRLSSSSRPSSRKKTRTKR